MHMHLPVCVSVTHSCLQRQERFREFEGEHRGAVLRPGAAAAPRGFGFDFSCMQLVVAFWFFKFFATIYSTGKNHRTFDRFDSTIESLTLRFSLALLSRILDISRLIRRRHGQLV